MAKTRSDTSSPIHIVCPPSWRLLATRRPLILALALSVGSAGCLFYDTDQEICLDLTVSYEGSAQGPVIATVFSKRDTLAFASVSRDEEVRLLLSGERHIQHCAPRLEHLEDVAVVTVWMDVDGSGTRCLEGPGEHTLPAYGRMTSLHLTLKEP
jgi:hypothetical protein